MSLRAYPLMILLGIPWQTFSEIPRPEHPRPDALRTDGLYYYDRRTKFDVKRIRAMTSRRAAYERRAPMTPPPPPRPVVRKIQTSAAPDGKPGNS